LVSRGNQVHVITQRIQGQKDDEIRCGVTIRRVGRPITYSGVLTTGFVESFTYLVEALVVGSKFIRTNDVDIIHSNTYVPAIAGQFCAWICRRIHVVTVHDVYLLTMPWFWEMWSRQPRVSFLARIFGPVFEAIVIRLPATVIHTVSQTSKSDLLRAGCRRPICVIPNGIALADYLLDKKTARIRHQAVFVGRLVFYKNLDVIFHALEKVIRRVRDAQLIIVGDGEMRCNWQRLVHQLGLSQHVEFRGRVPHEVKVGLLRESAFLVLPSMVEGFGIVVLEAFACGRPVIASSIGALKELITEGVDGYLINPSSVEEWTDRMIRLFADPQLASEMGEKGRRKLIVNYSMKHILKEFVRLYESL